MKSFMRLQVTRFRQLVGDQRGYLAASTVTDFFRNFLPRLATCVVLIVFWTNGVFAEKIGQFKGELVLKILPDGRDMELVRLFEYIDSHDVIWIVPAGTRIDGASIPRVLWTLVGSPFVGKYREASVIHDHYCDTKSRHWKAVHKVFLDGMLARGVEKNQARLMYIAVYRFGPRWDFDIDACFCKGCPACVNPLLQHIDYYKPKYNETDFLELIDKLNEGFLSLRQLENLADYQINTEILVSP